MVIKKLIVTSLVLCCGCNSIWNGWLDPSQVGRFRKASVTTDIRRSISVADEPAMDIDAEDPTPADLKVGHKDYVLQSGDLIDISIFELMVPGTPWVEMRQISRGGYITLPQVRQDILARGKTARELEKYIEKVLQDEQILTQPDVTVLIREARNMTYNILGAVNSPGSNVIPRPNFRILDAVAGAGGVIEQPTTKTLYVFRRATVSGKKGESAASDSENSALDICFGSVTSDTKGSSGHWVWTNGEWKFIKVPVAPPATTRSAATAPTTAPMTQTQPATTQTTKPAVKTEGDESGKWEELAAKTPSQRIIAIPLDKLERGDPRVNIVVRNGDTIWVPPPTQGEFYVMGNVLRPGVYSLTGREITLRQAMSAAGGMSPLADPMRCELIRRIGGNQEQVISVNLDAIFAGKESDIILKPDDILNVGTNPAMPFLAVLRNAFRFTYGFGFVYDRNFADIDTYTTKENPDTIRRQRKAQLRQGL